jgi:hypothetical protein
MIHFIEEGGFVHIGLNITTGSWRRPWVTFSWVWFSPRTAQLSHRRIRFRTFMRPFILTSKFSKSVVDDWLMMRGMVAVYREILEETQPGILALADAYKEHGYPSNGAEIPILHIPH